MVETVRRAWRGLIDADLGGGIKQRIARAGQGRSGGYRMLPAYREGHRAVFLYGFAKSERENITDDELQTLRGIGAIWLAADARRIADSHEELSHTLSGTAKLLLFNGLRGHKKGNRCEWAT